ncbi:MAG: pimeloyl-ACP methyl ester esterase BioH [Gammaproteobacteria bacterium]|nr:pimeloyl-ACP methyl ester esterase BioH [Gammaproteobacteria bacterium]
MNRLHTRVVGRGPDLVLLHGWGMNESVWSVILPRLSGLYRVTLVELPGHGNSGCHPDQDTLASWAEACLDVAPRKADWLGWSLGGLVAVQAGLDAPCRIRKLVLVNSSPKFVKEASWPHAVEESVLRQFSSALKKNPGQTLNRFLSLQVRGDDSARMTLRLLREDVARRPDPKLLALEQGLALLLTVDLRNRLTDLRCPSLWLLGERDTLVPAAIADDLARISAPGVKVRILEGCAHALFISHPAECLSALHEFIGGEQ